MNTPIEFCRLANGNCFTVWQPPGWPRGDVFEKTGGRSARRCDITKPAFRLKVPARTLIVWHQEPEIL